MSTLFFGLNLNGQVVKAETTVPVEKTEAVDKSTSGGTSESASADTQNDNKNNGAATVDSKASVAAPVSGTPNSAGVANENAANGSASTGESSSTSGEHAAGETEEKEDNASGKATDTSKEDADGKSTPSDKDGDASDTDAETSSEGKKGETATSGQETDTVKVGDLAGDAGKLSKDQLVASKILAADAASTDNRTVTFTYDYTDAAGTDQTTTATQDGTVGKQLTIAVPDSLADKYVLADEQATTYTVTDDADQAVTVKLVDKVVTYDKNSTNVPEWVKELQHNVTVKLNINAPDGSGVTSG